MKSYWGIEVKCEGVRGIGVVWDGDKAGQMGNLYIFTDFKPAVFVPIMTGLFISLK